MGFSSGSAFFMRTLLHSLFVSGVMIVVGENEVEVTRYDESWPDESF